MIFLFFMFHYYVLMMLAFDIFCRSSCRVWHSIEAIRR